MASDEVNAVGTAVLLAAAPAGRGRAMDAASVLPALAAVPPGVLTGTDMATVVELADPLDPQAVLTRLRAAAATPGPLALYLAGQLQLDRRQRLPHLSLARSTPTTLRYTGLPWHWLTTELSARRPGTTTVIADLAADPGLWQLLTANRSALEPGPSVGLFARVTPFPKRGTLTTPDYLRHYATVWRSGARPPLADLHAEAATASGSPESILLAPTEAAPAPAPGSMTPPSRVEVACIESPPTRRLGGGGLAARVPARAAARSAPAEPASEVPAATRQAPPPSQPSAGPASAPERLAAPPAAHTPGSGAAPGAAAAHHARLVPEPGPSPEDLPEPTATAPTATAPTATGPASAPDRGAAAPVPPVAAPQAAAGAQGPRPAASPAPVAGAQPPHPAPTVNAPPPPPPRRAPDMAAPAPQGQPPVPPRPGDDGDPHPAILAAAMAGRHSEAAAVAAAWEGEALRRHGPRSGEAVHWVEVRADLARLAGEPARSCELWIAAAQARLGMRQDPKEPDVEGAVDRAHHQWEQIRDPARARALGPALVDLRRRVPGRHAGALAALQRRLS
ncbi:hypothetical protein ACIGEZ_22690 [Streptomyces sp. NPDC085481]|uniref:hypothetical protein n=1 Tax=Streptomyces sp. NPDC085481 TaxID=3365727 RepID=UPI0037CFB59B